MNKSANQLALCHSKSKSYTSIENYLEKDFKV